MDTDQQERIFWRLVSYMVVFLPGMVLPFVMVSVNRGISGGGDTIDFFTWGHIFSPIGIIPALMAVANTWTFSQLAILRAATWPRRIGVLIAPMAIWIIVVMSILGLKWRFALIPLMVGTPWYVLALLGRFAQGLRYRPAQLLSLPIAALLIILIGGVASAMQHDSKGLGLLFISTMQAPALAALLLGGLAERLEKHLAAKQSG